MHTLCKCLMLPALALLIAACSSNADQRRAVADRILGPAETNECRADRAVSLVDVSAEIWPDQDWTQARAAAQLMAENVALEAPKFDALATNFAYQYYTPLVALAIESGVDLAGSGAGAAAKLLIEGLDVINRIPQSALAVGKVRAAVAACAARGVA